MLLGRSIDLTSYSIGGNIYDDAQFTETPVRTLNTTFQVLREDVSPYASFGVPVDIVLRIKSGFLGSSSGAMGLDGLLKDTTWKHNSVVVAATTVARTVDRRLNESASPLQDWSSKIPPTQTHYASALYHGGWVVTLFRFQCDVPADVISVRKVLTRHLGASGCLDNATVEAWQKALDDLKSDEDIRGSVKTTTLVYTSVHLEDQVIDPTSLLQVASKLPDLIGPIGQPIYMELEPIRKLDKNFPAAKQNNEMQAELEKLDLMLDDVKIAKTNMMKWLSDTMTAFEDDQEEKIYKLLNVINGCIRAFHKVGGEVSMFRPMDRGLLDPAYHYYLNNLERGIANYNLAFLRLKEEIGKC
ncbi:hypothetical protein JTE90_023538 [Oedothorax gibbosus]|uniref:Uncharacterized protein n=1 Tax=Oedothorax gibbosus TaxID=931172 RepID=A0AAV6ULE2_9ARAC|nr:hypothetical protein JTE90_023538 [Oedothorax gibbosus]